MSTTQTKHVEVEYIESGTFQGGEEDVSKANIDYGEDCIVIKKVDFEKLRDMSDAIAKAREALEQFSEHVKGRIPADTSDFLSVEAIHALRLLAALAAITPKEGA